MPWGREKVVLVAKFRLRQAAAHLPAPAARVLERRRHLRHVLVNQQHLVDPAYLGNPPADAVQWLTPDHRPPLPQGGLALARLTDADRAAARAWLAAGPYDDDATLDARTDNHGDEIGRVKAALRLRLALADAPAAPLRAAGLKVIVDARSVQTATFGARGIGRFARTALLAVREAVGDANTVLLVDRALEVLPVELAGECEQVHRVDTRDVARYSVLVESSPMTASPEPLLALLHSDAHKIAIVFDFIPAHYPTIYLRHPAARAEYAAQLDALRKYDDFIGISHLAVTELRQVLDQELTTGKQIETAVAWPSDVLPAGTMTSPAGGTGPIVVMTGDEARKNTFGALAAIGAATAGDDAQREVVVLGMAGQGVKVHHWSISAVMRPGETTTLGRISDEEMRRVLADASLVVVSSFDEGLSLPVIEALASGTPVVASDIAAHRELIGTGSFLVPAGDIRAMTQAIRKHRGRAQTQREQMRVLAQHRHDDLEPLISGKVTMHLNAAAHRHATAPDLPTVRVDANGRRLRVAVATPWPPQRTGIADYSAATVGALADLADVTILTTSDAQVDDPRISHRPVDDLLAQPELAREYDVVLCVIGNSHFHVPFLELLGTVDAVALAHDTRMVEYYTAMRAKGGAVEVMLRGQTKRVIDPSFDDQLDDLRLLQNAGLWEIAHQARMLVLHSPVSAPRIEAETGVTPRVLPFAHYRTPHVDEVTDAIRREARERLGFDSSRIHLATFGYVDVRTKQLDVVVEAAAWLTQWGHSVALHLVGAASDQLAAELTHRAEQAGIAEFEITGYVDEDRFRDYLLAIDLGVQLRISPLLGVSGPLADLAAYGTPAVGSRGLTVDVGTPPFIDQLPDQVSPLVVAEAIEHRLANPVDAQTRERQRLAYLAERAPARYAEQLLGLLREAAGVKP